MRYLKVVALLGVVGGNALSVSTASAEAVTYGFSGTVQQSRGDYASIAVGSIVTGAFTIDFDAATSVSSTPIGSQSNWGASSSGGTFRGTPVPDPLVFTVSASVNGTNLSAGTSTYSVFSSVNAGSGVLNSSVDVVSDTNHNFDVNFGIRLVSHTRFPAVDDGLPFAYLSNGLPNLSALNLSKSTGDITETLNFSNPGILTFTFTSLQATSAVPPDGQPVIYTIPTPLPGSLGLELSAFGGLGVYLGFRNRRRKETDGIVRSTGTLCAL